MPGTVVKESRCDPSATVLVVEDDRPLLEFFSVLLRRDGYSILAASNGGEALEIADSAPNARIDILLNGVAMPHMDGIQLSERLRENRPDINVLLISGLPQQTVLDRCPPSFTPNFLSKPFSVTELSGMVRHFAAAV